MSHDQNAAAQHLPEASAERIAINMFVGRMTKYVTVGIRQDHHYTLEMGQVLLSDCRSVLEQAQEGQLVWKIEGLPTFALVIDYCNADKQWKILQADFFYRDRLRQAILLDELRVLGYRPRKLEALQQDIA